MNVGYGIHTDFERENVNCPLCGSDVYFSKYGDDFRCVNENCAANINAKNVIRILNVFIDEYLED